MKRLATCHVHSKWSYDGSWSLEDLSEKFSGRGSCILLMTEHDRGFTPERWTQYREACQQVSSDKILVVPGIEYSDAENRVHVLVWGAVPFLGENLPTGEMLAKVKSYDGVAVLAHPSRKEVWKSYDPGWDKNLLGIETWNRKYDGWAPSRTAPGLIKNSGAVPFVGLDFHTRRQIFPLTMALDVEGAVTEENVLRCLRSRRCYAQAFGRALNESHIQEQHPILNTAEKGRRAIARFGRKVTSLARRRNETNKI